MHLKPLDLSRHAAWDTYVLSHAEGSPFHLLAWHNAIARAFAHRPLYHYAEQDGRIRGILPLFQIKSLLFGNILSSVPFAAYGGILADSEAAFTMLLEYAKETTKALAADYLELKFQHPKETSLPQADLHVTFIKEISADNEANMQAIPRKQRAMVRKGMAAGLEAVIGNDLLDEFYKVFAINVHRLGTPVYPKSWFQALLDMYGDQAEVMVVRHQGKTISGVVTLYYKDTVLPYYAASFAEYRSLAPNDFQYWELMRHAVERGCRFFDYGRSKKDSGHCSFKKNWGFTPQPLHYQFFLNKLKQMPQLNPMNPKHQWKIKVWKKLPLPLANWLGPSLVKNIP